MKRTLSVIALALTSLTAGAVERPSGTCPGGLIAATCGNSTCDVWLGENAQSCPNDCLESKVKSYNSTNICTEVKQVVDVESWDHAKDVILASAAKGEKVRVIATRHSVSDSICSDGTVIKTVNMNKIHGLETLHGEDVVLVDSGVMTWELSEWLHERNKTIGVVTVGYREATIGGTIINGSHGSSATENVFMPSLLRWVEILDGEGNYHTYDKATTDPKVWRSLSANLGMFGLVTRMKVAVEPQFNLDTKITFGKESEFFDDTGILDEVANCDFVIVNWFAQSGQYMKTCGVRSSRYADRNADNKIIDPYPSAPEGFGALVKPIWHAAICDADRSAQGFLERQKVFEFKVMPPLQKQGWLLPIRSTEVVGPSHRMATSKLSKDGDKVANLDFEIFVPQQHVQAAMEEIDAIFEKYNASAFTVGIYLRFSKTDPSSYLSIGAEGGPFKVGETGMFVEFPVVKPAGFYGDWMEWYTTPYREAANALITKFGGRPHAGKNDARIFGVAREHQAWGNNLTEYKSVLNQFPASPLFSNKFAQQMGIRD